MLIISDTSILGVRVVTLEMKTDNDYYVPSENGPKLALKIAEIKSHGWDIVSATITGSTYYHLIFKHI